MADRKKASMTKRQLHRVYETMWVKEVEGFMNEIFLAGVTMPSLKKPLVGEVYTNSQRVLREAQRRGHNVGPPMSLESGWNFLEAKDRKRALEWVREHEPFMLVLAFPCNFWTQLLELNPPKDPEGHFLRGLTLLRFALELAEEQIKHGRHYMLENPAGSKAWKLDEVRRWLTKFEALVVKFDQCQFGLRCALSGLLHMKPTLVATSSQAVASKFLNKRCKRDHQHAQVIGGSRITSPAGRYPVKMASAIVQGAEEQFEWDVRHRSGLWANEAHALEDGDDGLDDLEEGLDRAIEEDTPAGPQPGEGAFEFIHEESGSDVEVPGDIQTSSAVQQAAKRLHENTGHRSRKRLARALAISGASTEAIAAAKRLKCSVCDERKRAKPPKPASLPVPKDVNDQVHIDLFHVYDAAETKHTVVHMTDFSSRYQMAAMLETKATSEVVAFIKQNWLPLLGPPRVLVCDHGREFVSHEFETFCAGLGIYVYFTGIGAPWQNGVAERSGGSLKAILGAVIAAHSVIGMSEMKNVLGEATMAYNMDVGDSGFSPLQVVTGRQPRLQGDVLGGIQQRLSEHSLISSSTSMARSLAMRETAKLAMTRLHFSKGLRRAELARSRTTTLTTRPEAGDIVYFFRDQKYRGRQAKRVLALRRWHGPCLLVAYEGDNNVFVSHKGQLVKCSVEQVRKASSLEQISSDAWQEAIQECIQAALKDKEPSKQPPLGDPARQQASSEPSPPQPLISVDVEQSPQHHGPDSVPQPALGSQDGGSGLISADPTVPADGLDLPPVGAREFVTAGARAGLTLSAPESEVGGSGLTSRRTSTLPSASRRGSFADDLTQRMRTSRLESSLERALSLTWPIGQQDYEALSVQASRKEYPWSTMSPFQKEEFRKACDAGWSVWSENEAVEILSPSESKRVVEDLRKRGEGAKLLRPRWVFTDKNDGLRTESRDLPLRASSRLVVPGYQDESAYGLRKDAPTCSRTSQHVLFTVTSSRYAEGWRIYSADIKSAFMKGDRYEEGSREIYLQNIGGTHDMPQLPIPEGCIGKIVKGVFGLSDAPRQWYLKLNKSLVKRGWVRSPMDHAAWFLWKKGTTELHGMILSHVDDLLLGGDQVAYASLMDLGGELGFGAIDKDEFVYCGKRIRQEKTGIIYVTMDEYHANLQPIKILGGRRKALDDELDAGELKQLRGLLGSLQWLVAQVRLDMGYHLSVLQGEKPCVGTMVRANALLTKFKATPGFGLTFKPLNMKDGGIVVVTDSSLGNVRQNGSPGEEPLERLYSQSCYFVLFVEKEMLEGKTGGFTVLDGRSHRLPRVCRSTFAAELLGAEEAFDIGQYTRGFMASILGYPLLSRHVDAATDAIPLCVVTDAKDVFDKSVSDTHSYGSQKSLVFTISWIRGMLRKPNTSLKWTSTENMWVDAGTKDMEMDHMHRILGACEWSIKYTSAFIKQGSKGVKKKNVKDDDPELIGEPVPRDAEVLPHLMTLSEGSGWHERAGVGIHVARNAKSLRLPFPRFEPAKYPTRSTYARLDFKNGNCEWRCLEEKVAYMSLQSPQRLLGTVATVLITFFHADTTEATKEEDGL